jgi:Spy/CpxP family protein refolding chaperone
MKLYPLIVFLFTSSLMAQQPQPDQTGPVPCQRSTDDLKAALGLDDSQIASLETVKLERREAQAPIIRQLAENWRALNDALKSGQTDAVTLGKMLLDIESLRAQRKNNDSRYDEQALAVLTAEQQEKLKKLRMALKLQSAARQAIWLGLLERPRGIFHGEQGDDSDLGPELF